MGQEEAAYQIVQAEGAVSTGHPKGFYFIFWGEFAERCSYYGMRAILPLYLTSALLFSDADATSTYAYFKAACYLLPLLGGFLADRYFGKYWTIVGFSVPYVLGHFVLGIQTDMFLVIALFLLAGGSGVIKPNISTLMGKTYDQQRPGQKALLTSAFVWFYFSINVGAGLSQYVLPQIREHLINSHLAPYELKEETVKASDGNESKVYTAIKEGERREINNGEAEELKVEARRYAYRLTFQIPAWLMVAALGAFALGKRHYAIEPSNPGLLLSDARFVLAYFGNPARVSMGVRRGWRNMLYALGVSQSNQELGDDAKGTASDETIQRWHVLARLFGIFGLIVFFWVAYEQNDNLWTFFARDHIAERVVDSSTGKGEDTCVLRLGSWEKNFPPDGFQFINALLIIIFVPLLGIMWRKIDPHGTRFPATWKMLIGFLFTASASGVMALASFQAQGDIKVSAWWMVLGYFVLTAGEILVYGTGLELSYTAAPASMKGFVTACFLVTNSVGNLINSRLSPLYKKDIPEGQFFALTAGIVILASIAFYFVGRRFNRGAPSHTATNEVQ